MISLPVGTRITCEAGHVVCEVVKEVVQYGMGDHRWFGNYAAGIDPIVPGPVKNQGCTCGALWFRITDPASGVIHVEGHGWWPRLEDRADG